MQTVVKTKRWLDSCLKTRRMLLNDGLDKKQTSWMNKSLNQKKNFDDERKQHVKHLKMLVKKHKEKELHVLK